MPVESKIIYPSLKSEEIIVKENLALVHSLIKRYSNRGVDYDDLLQIGSIGLLKAARRFNPSLGYTFSTYASSLILGEIRRHFRDDGMIKISRHLKETANKIKILSAKFALENFREPTISELAEISGISAEDIAASLDATKETSSFEAEFFEGKSPSNTFSTGGDESEKTIDKLAIKNCLQNLNVKEKFIIAHRYFKDKTQKETADILGISQVQVSRIEKKALAKMKRFL